MGIGGHLMGRWEGGKRGEGRRGTEGREGRSGEDEDEGGGPSGHLTSDHM